MKIFVPNTSEIMTKNGLLRPERVSKDSVFLSREGREISPIHISSEHNKKLLKITLMNGTSFLLDESSKLMTSLKMKKSRELSVGDMVEFSFRQYINESEPMSIETPQRLSSNSNPIKIPIRMNDDFALFCGIYMSKGYFTEASSQVFFSYKMGIKAIINDVCFKNLRVIPDEDSRKGKENICYITSHNLVSYLKDNFGNSNSFKKIPKQILEGPNSVQLSFILGLSLDGYRHKNKLFIYSGNSKKLAEFCAVVLRSNGYHVYQIERDSSFGKSQTNSKRYEVAILSYSEKQTNFFSLYEKNNEGIKKGRYQVRVLDNYLDHPFTNKSDLYKRREITPLILKYKMTTSNNRAKSFKIMFDTSIYFIEIKKIEEVMESVIIFEFKDSVIYNSFVLVNKDSFYCLDSEEPIHDPISVNSESSSLNKAKTEP